jgi:hypothetical protein
MADRLATHESRFVTAIAFSEEEVRRCRRMET